jgi:lipoate-protein ligase A
MLIALPNAYGDAAQNMAIDAALLSSLPQDTSLFRHYAWTEPTVTFGYAQKWEAVHGLFPSGLQLCRRITGGGIVDHRNDWTYSMVLPRNRPSGDDSPTRLYRELHLSIAQALASLGIETQLAPCPRHCESTAAPTDAPSVSQCFVEASADDVLRPDGVKIAGAALKRTRQALLIQGSIDRQALPSSLDYDAFQKAFLSAICQIWKLEIKQPEDLRPFFQAALINQEKERFNDLGWLRKR